MKNPLNGSPFFLSKNNRKFLKSGHRLACKFMYPPNHVAVKYPFLSPPISWNFVMLLVEHIEKITGTAVRIDSHAHIPFWYSTNKYKFNEKRFNPFEPILGNYHAITVSVGKDSAEKQKAETKRLAVFLACVQFIKWYNQTVKTNKKVPYRA